MAEAKNAEVHPDFNKKSSTGLDAKIAMWISHAGILLYGWGGFLSGLIMYILEKENKYVKFHAMQSMIVGIAGLVLRIIFVVLFNVIRGMMVRTYLLYYGAGWWTLFTVLAWLVVIAEFVIRLIIVTRANKGELYKFPFFGNLAEKYTK